MKRLYEGDEVNDLRSTFQEKPEAGKDASTSPEREEIEAENVVGQNDKQNAVPVVGESGGNSLN
jgi:hypothetical protein